MDFKFDINKIIANHIDAFNAGMDRDFGAFHPIETPALNLGAGNKQFPWAKSIQRPQWDAETQPLPFFNGEFNAVIAFHFLEHIRGERLPELLAEVSRVLTVGGTFTVVVPHRLGGMAFQDPDHKTFFTENTWRLLLNNKYYSTHAEGIDIPFFMTTNIIFGETERTLALLTQFVKV